MSLLVRCGLRSRKPDRLHKDLPAGSTRISRSHHNVPASCPPYNVAILLLPRFRIDALNASTMFQWWKTISLALHSSGGKPIDNLGLVSLSVAGGAGTITRTTFGGYDNNIA